MALSPAHQFGQYLGNLLEELLLPELERFATDYGAYVDKHGERPGVRPGKKATWQDKYGNNHDLDFVVERGGSATKKGRPLAFIEAAWRRYTKHSRNKAQEIQGAVLPMAETFAWDKPFLGAFLAGHFTRGSLTQLRSLGFSVVYVSYEDYLAAFSAYGIDIAFDENTDDARFTDCLAQIAAGGKKLKADVLAQLVRSNRDEIDDFLAKLHKKLMRHPIGITIVTLFGTTHDFADMKAAVDFVRTHQPDVGDGTFRGFEVIVRYSNDDRIDGFFKDPAEVGKFLEYAAS